MGLSSYTISLTTAMVLMALTAVMCTSVFAYYQTKSELPPAMAAADNAQKQEPPGPPKKEVATTNITLFWNNDTEAVNFINNVRSNNTYKLVVCVFHPSCGFSKQFTDPFADFAERLQTSHKDVIVVKIFPKDMSLIVKLFEPINIRGYPTVLGDFKSTTRVLDQYTPQSTSKPFRSPESLTEYVNILQTKSNVVVEDDQEKDEHAGSGTDNEEKEEAENEKDQQPTKVEDKEPDDKKEKEPEPETEPSVESTKSVKKRVRRKTTVATDES